MGHIDKETLARHNGQPLLDEEGVEALGALLESHRGYEDANKLHAEEIKALQTQIDALVADRDGLIAERDQQTSTQNRARWDKSYKVREATKASRSSNNPVYATIINVAAKESQSGLWHPESLVAADEMGRSFVDLDEALRSTHKPLPAMVIETERGGWTNLFLARTRRLASLRATSVAVPSKFSNRQQKVNRTALALPIREGSTSMYQIGPNFLWQGGSIDDYTREPSEHSNIQDGFKLVVPHDSKWGTSPLGEYDLPEGGTAELRGNFGWERDTKVAVAIGDLSVAHALLDLQTSFSETSRYPDSIPPIFEQLGQRALGKSMVAIKQLVEA